MNRKKVQKHHYLKLGISAVLIGIAASLLAFSLKFITEYFQEHIFEWAIQNNRFYFILLPTIGITAIYFLRKHLFKKRRNKGITEIYKTLYQRKDHLPLFKIPSHYLNGFLTVIFGGSTGIEVSTVVATATIGNYAYKKRTSANSYKLELICAGITAGVAILFASPIGGLLFSLEVIARKVNKSLLIACGASALVAWGLLFWMGSKPLIDLGVSDWKWSALPFFMLLSLCSGALSTYFTKLVIHIKSYFSGINNNFISVNSGALLVGGMLCFAPYLYGDSYHGVSEVLINPQGFSILFLLLLALLKPLAAALTLGAGGDGGVFAPSIVAGAFLGVAFALLCNALLGTSLIYINFALVGAAATLSASIYAPFTALFLICNMVPNGFSLFFPILLGAWIAKLFAKKLLPYNVYTYKMDA